MKKLAISIVLTFVILFNGLAFGQLSILKGIKIAGNWSTFHGDSLEGIQTLQSYAGGLNFEFILPEQWFLHVDILYSPQGIASQENGDLECNYIAIPIFIKKQFFPHDVHPFLSAGIEFSYLVSSKRNGENVKSQMNSQVLGIVIGGGLGFEIFNIRAYLECTYHMGIDNVYQTDTPEFHYNYKNRNFRFALGILF